MLTEQVELENKERQIRLMKQQIEKLTEARKVANESTPVLNLGLISSDPTMQSMFKLLQTLQHDQEERDRLLKLEQEREAKEERERIEKEKSEQERLDEEREEMQRRKQPEEQQEEERRRKQENLGKEGDPPASEKEVMSKVLHWIERQEKQEKEEKEQRGRLRNFQAQLEDMNRDKNKRTCHIAGVNLFGRLEALQGEGVTGPDLAAKAQAAMLAVTSAKRKREDGEESEGESLPSKGSPCSHKAANLRSGLASVSAQKVKVEVEWAHHWLGKELKRTLFHLIR